MPVDLLQSPARGSAPTRSRSRRSTLTREEAANLAAVRSMIADLARQLSARPHLKPEPPEYVLLGREDDPVAKRLMWD